MHTYPHTIENGEGEVLTFLGVVRDQYHKFKDAPEPIMET